MVNSMTGYGRASVTFGDKTITAELRSVNNRYLDCTVRCPRLYAFLEEPAKARLKAAGVTRGKVDMFIGIEYAAGDSEVCINASAVNAYLAALKEMTEEYGLKDDVSAMGVARLPDVFTVKKVEEDRDQLLVDVCTVLDQAIAAFVAMRQTEGSALRADVLAKTDELERMKCAVRERMPLVVSEYREKLLAKMRELLGDRQVDESRILTEAAIVADRVATDEETVRLESHFTQLRTLLDSNEPVGRKLDFLVQEIHREINTIGSKASDLTVTKLILDMKAELEKIREQIQNIE
ncbi:MAG: YicC family protein [Clostridia bacterium]|nr:YicC family protein [Clostridia bacterium]